MLDGDGATVPDAMLEIWQADSAGSLQPIREDQARNLPLDASFRGLRPRLRHRHQDGNYSLRHHASRAAVP